MRGWKVVQTILTSSEETWNTGLRFMVRTVHECILWALFETK